MAFTTLIDGASLRVLIKELVDAYNERVEAWGRDDTKLVEFVDGTGMFNVLPTMQTNLEDPDFFDDWVNDDDADGSGKFSGQSAIPWLTLADLRTAAGNGTGIWRRCRSHPATGPTYEATNGVMLDGDIVGWWIIEDLQTIIDLYRWSSVPITNQVFKDRQGSASEATYAEAVSQAEANFTADTWATGGLFTSFGGQARSNDEEVNPDEMFVQLKRERTTGDIDLSGTDIECEMDVYVSPNVRGSNTYDPLDVAPAMTSGVNVLNHVNNYAKSNYGTINWTSPTSDNPPSMPASSGEYGLGFAGDKDYPLGGGVSEIDAYAIAKWDFTHTL